MPPVTLTDQLHSARSTECDHVDAAPEQAQPAELLEGALGRFGRWVLVLFHKWSWMGFEIG